MPRRINRYHHPKSPALRIRNEEIVQARMLGGTFRGIARRFHLSPRHVHRIAGDVAVLFSRQKRPPKSRARPERWQRFFRLRGEARELRKLGYSYREIAERLGISPSLAFKAARMVKIAELRGRAWQSHREGRPKAWKRELQARAKPQTSPCRQDWRKLAT